MRSTSSAVFRRQCLALALLAATWALPSTSRADAYGLQSVKSVADTLKPNVLVVLETAESMQDLPGENAARYNEVGSDCEEGNRSCRLVGQKDRWNFSGMGQVGINFGAPPASCTSTYTAPSIITQTYDTTATYIATATVTNSNTNTGTVSQNQTQTVTNSNTLTNSNTVTSSNTVTNTATGYGTNTSTAYGSSTATSFGTVTSTALGSVTATTYGTVTSTALGTVTSTAYGTVTSTAYGTVTSTALGTVP